MKGDLWDDSSLICPISKMWAVCDAVFLSYCSPCWGVLSVTNRIPLKTADPLCSSSLHLTPVFLQEETSACFCVERNRLKSNTWLFFCQYFSMGFLLKDVPSSKLPESSGRMCCCLCPWPGQPELQAVHLLRSDFLGSSFQCFSSFHFLMK